MMSGSVRTLLAGQASGIFDPAAGVLPACCFFANRQHPVYNGVGQKHPGLSQWIRSQVRASYHHFAYREKTAMARYHVEISHERTPIRLLRSDLLEFFTHIHPAVILVIWLPVVGFFLARAVLEVPADTRWAALTIPVGFIAGLFFWTLAEYVLHYATHHWTMRRGYWRFLKRHHMQHHCKTPDQRFGVSSPLWDLVLGTQPGRRLH
jgi:sterol desaturase/sphingolipid hydroxylase (fatty acid hydroxylase superfamily)